LDVTGEKGDAKHQVLAEEKVDETYARLEHSPQKSLTPCTGS
jgi:hypothetical protein